MLLELIETKESYKIRHNKSQVLYSNYSKNQYDKKQAVKQYKKDVKNEK